LAPVFYGILVWIKVFDARELERWMYSKKEVVFYSYAYARLSRHWFIWK